MPMIPLPPVCQATYGCGVMTYAPGDLRSRGPTLQGTCLWLPRECLKNLKPEHLTDAKAAFNGTHVNVTAEVRPYLGALLGTQDYCDKFVADKVIEWKAGREVLSLIAETQPHAAYAAVTHGLAGKWIYLTQTSPNIATLLLPLEDVLRGNFLPAPAPPNTVEHDFLALLARLGGIGLCHPSMRAPDEFAASVVVTSPLKYLIQVAAKSDVHNRRRAQQQDLLTS